MSNELLTAAEPINAESLKKQLAILKRELSFIGREVQRIECTDSDGFESVDAIAQAVQIGQTAIFEIELQGQPENTEGEWMAA